MFKSGWLTVVLAAVATLVAAEERQAVAERYVAAGALPVRLPARRFRGQSANRDPRPRIGRRRPRADSLLSRVVSERVFRKRKTPKSTVSRSIRPRCERSGAYRPVRHGCSWLASMSGAAIGSPTRSRSSSVARSWHIRQGLSGMYFEPGRDFPIFERHGLRSAW